MKNVKVSVIVPVYNKEKYLKECIDSILGQDYRQIELILVDDASTDGSGAICDRYAAKENVKVIHQENGGPTAACVRGMQEAQGAYFMFVDSDDYIDAKTISSMAARLQQKKGEIVCCNHLLEKQKKTEKIASGAAPGTYTGEKLQKEIKGRLIGQETRAIPMSRCMKLIERSLFEGNEKYYDYAIRFSDDLHLMYPVLLSSSRVVIMEDAYFYHYRYVSGSIIHRYDEKMEDSVNRLIASLTEAAKDKAPEQLEAVKREYCYMMLYVMKNELRSPAKDYRRRIGKIFTEPETRKKIEQTPIAVHERANTLLYMGMVYPSKGLIMALRLIMRLYDRK